MGLVCDVWWDCPECGHKKNQAQLYGTWDDPEEGISHKAVPANRVGDLKWNRPCEGCGKTILKAPKHLMEIPIVQIDEENENET